MCRKWNDALLLRVGDVLSAFRISVRSLICGSMCMAFVSINWVIILTNGGTHAHHFVRRACASACSRQLHYTSPM
jgi:hypothetical protein